MTDAVDLDAGIYAYGYRLRRKHVSASVMLDVQAAPTPTAGRRCPADLGMFLS